MTNYLKIKSDGTTVATTELPTWGEVSNTGDYYIDGKWYDKTGTEYVEQFTYASNNGKLLEVEVADNQPVDLHYDELAPDLVRDTIFATDVKTNTLTLAETKWINEDGIEYFDDGLLGVPDTTFSSTGARIYPDGTIRGKSSYGEYVKSPDGRLEMTAHITQTDTSYVIVWGFPHLNTSLEKSYTNAVTRKKYGGNNDIVSVFPHPNSITSESSTVFQLQTTPATNYTGGGATLSCVFIGEWK
jgi:hypothetical protein